MADRGYLGTMPAASERDDEAYLEYVESLRMHILNKVRATAVERGQQAVAEYEARTGRPVADIATYRAVLDSMPIVATRNRLMRTQQEMMWNGIVETYAKRKTELLAELDAYDKRGPGTVQWDPNFVYPEYYDSTEFHIQPGSYHRDPLAGYYYHYGTKIFTVGQNDYDQIQRAMINLVPVPADGQVRRILDLGVSIGQCTTAFKERFPQAEVWGIDVAAPMIRYAHKRAVDLGLDVHFAQRLAEDTGFPDNSMDIVFAYILFHEIPPAIREKVVAEAHRVLRPGGLFIVVDFPNRSAADRPEWADYARDFDTKENGEPYASLFVYSDFHDLLRRTFRALAPGGRVVIRDFILEPDKTAPRWAVLFALNMLVATRGGATYTEAEYSAWLEEAGFVSIERPQADLILARRP
ncbi:MAG: methyltransferase domain-containing protein [Dehalococcoidia bacterium]|nr:methyltransferase domain-containing protein [Dehalococcoidia bacterium]